MIVSVLRVLPGFVLRRTGQSTMPNGTLRWPTTTPRRRAGSRCGAAVGADGPAGEGPAAPRLGRLAGAVRDGPSQRAAKLSASALNNLGVASLIAGLQLIHRFAPIVSHAPLFAHFHGKPRKISSFQCSLTCERVVVHRPTHCDGDMLRRDDMLIALIAGGVMLQSTIAGYKAIQLLPRLGRLAGRLETATPARS
jgi:hypothetical protein